TASITWCATSRRSIATAASCSTGFSDRVRARAIAVARTRRPSAQSQHVEKLERVRDQVVRAPLRRRRLAAAEAVGGSDRAHRGGLPGFDVAQVVADVDALLRFDGGDPGAM